MRDLPGRVGHLNQSRPKLLRQAIPAEAALDLVLNAARPCGWPHIRRASLGPFCHRPQKGDRGSPGHSFDSRRTADSDLGLCPGRYAIASLTQKLEGIHFSSNPSEKPCTRRRRNSPLQRRPCQTRRLDSALSATVGAAPVWQILSLLLQSPRRLQHQIGVHATTALLWLGMQRANARRTCRLPLPWLAGTHFEEAKGGRDNPVICPRPL